MILEKAWAKIHKNFERIEGGIPNETLTDLTGAPSHYYHINNITPSDKL